MADFVKENWQNDKIGSRLRKPRFSAPNCVFRSQLQQSAPNIGKQEVLCRLCGGRKPQRLTKACRLCLRCQQSKFLYCKISTFRVDGSLLRGRSGGSVKEWVVAVDALRGPQRGHSLACPPFDFLPKGPPQGV